MNVLFFVGYFLFMLFLLLMVCGLTLYSVHHFIQTNEQEDFQKRYDDVSKSITESFLVDTRFKFWLAKSTATYMTSALAVLQHQQQQQLVDDSADSNNYYLNVTSSVANLDEMTRAQRLITFAMAVAWSPMIRTDPERAIFEASAAAVQQQQQQQLAIAASSAGSGGSQKCYICPINQRVSNPEKVVQIPGFGRTVTCGIVEKGGQTEVIASETCATVQALVSSLCQCEPTTTANNSNNKDDTGADLLVNNAAAPPMTTIFNGTPMTETANPVSSMASFSLSFVRNKNNNKNALHFFVTHYTAEPSHLAPVRQSRNQKFRYVQSNVQPRPCQGFKTNDTIRTSSHVGNV
jgi:hypothetical protein